MMPLDLSMAVVRWVMRWQALLGVAIIAAPWVVSAAVSFWIKRGK